MFVCNLPCGRMLKRGRHEGGTAFFAVDSFRKAAVLAVISPQSAPLREAKLHISDIRRSLPAFFS